MIFRCQNGDVSTLKFELIFIFIYLTLFIKDNIGPCQWI